MRRLVYVALGALAVALLVGAGFQGAPLPLTDALNRLRPGVGQPAAVAILDSTSTGYMMRTAGGTVPKCYPDRATVVFGARASATICIGLGLGLAIGDQTTASAVYITDALGGSSGNGNCVPLPAGGEWHTTIDVKSQRLMPGARTGVCGAPIAAAHALPGTFLRPPCRVAQDCVDLGAPAGTSCNTSPSESDWDESCAVAFGRGSAAATFVFDHPEK